MRSKHSTVAALLAIHVALGLGGAASAAEQPQAPSVVAAKGGNVRYEDQLTDKEFIQAGREKFVATCAYCHGAQGDSGKNKPFRERGKEWDPQLVHDTIADGRQRGANVMPGWKSSISDEEIWKMVAYIKSLSGKPRS